MIVVLDIGGTFIKHALMNDTGEILSLNQIPTPRDHKEHFVEVIKQIWESYPQPKEGLAISLPGTIETKSGMIYQGGSLQYLNQTNGKKLLEGICHTRVELENDARCATLAEVWKGNLQGIDQGMVLTFGTGIGGSFVLNGDLYKGAHLFSGEVSGWLTKDIKTYGRDAMWGNQGSIPALLKRICDQKQVSIQDGKTVFGWIEQGDPIACEIFHNYCKDLSIQLFNLQILLDPQRLCIGGGVSANPVFIKGIMDAMNTFYASLPLTLPHLEIVPCHFHNDANLIGAFHHFQKQAS